MGDVLRIEARRSLLLRLSPLVALAHVAIMLSQVSSWRGVWPQASAAVLSPLIFTAPALAGLTALEVSRRSTRWAAPRPIHCAARAYPLRVCPAPPRKASWTNTVGRPVSSWPAAA